MNKSTFVYIALLLTLLLSAAPNALASEISAGANRVIQFTHCTFPEEMVAETSPHEVEIGDVILSRFLLSHLNPAVSHKLVDEFENGDVEVYYYMTMEMGPGAFAPPMEPGSKPRFIFNLPFLVYASEFNAPFLYRLLSHEGQHFLDYQTGQLHEPGPMDMWTLETARQSYRGELRASKAEFEDVLRFGWHWKEPFMMMEDLMDESQGLESVTTTINRGHLMGPKFFMYVSDLQIDGQKWLEEECARQP